MKNDYTFKLNSKHSKNFNRKFKIAVNLMFLLNYVLIFIYIILIAIVSIIAYMESNINLSLTFMFIWFVISAFGIFYVIPLLMMSTFFGYMVTLYLKIRFRQVSERIDICFKDGKIYK